MKKILLSALAATLGLSAAASSNQGVCRGQSQLFGFATKARTELTQTVSSAISITSPRKATEGNTIDVHQLPPSSQVSYLDGPKGQTWFYTLDNVSTIIDHGTYKEEKISGYKIKVYNALFEEVGSIEDAIELGEGETRVAQVSVGSLVTQKFFNTDNSYEIMVSVACNTVDYTNKYHTYVYAINSNATTTEKITEVDGYLTSAVNTATDEWSEKYWLTFLTEEDASEENQMVGDVINAMDYVFTTYKYAGWSAWGDPVMVNRIPSIAIGGENAIPFLATKRDGIPYFAVNRLKYCWFEEPYNFENENPTADNELIIDIYSPATSFSTTVDKYSTTRMPLNATAEHYIFLYLGAFSYDDDLSFDRYTDDGTPSLIISTEYYLSASDDYMYDYDVYKAAEKGGDAKGVHMVSLGEGVRSGQFLNDIPGFDPQIMFLRGDNTSVTFDFVNLITGDVEASIPAATSGISLTTSTERVAYGDSYLYVAAQTRGESQENGDVYTFVAYFNLDGSIHHVDKLNLGKNVDYASVYIAPDAFDPYIFNLDSKREYMALVKRKDSPTSTGNHEELMVVSEDPEDAPLFVYTPADGLGKLMSVYFANLDTDMPRLIMITLDDNSKYVGSAYSLPLQLFDMGDGTMENPYVITSVGGLKQIKAFPSAHFALGCDIDAAGYEICNNSFDFYGTLDGNGHTISNLKVSGYSLIPSMSVPGSAVDASSSAIICDMNFIDPVFTTSKDNQGLVVGSMQGGTLRNVHIYEGKLNSEGTVGGLVGAAYLGSVIENCSVNADITSQEGVGGIVGTTRTGSTVRACAFTGSITGDSGIGGIVSEFGHADDRIENCHVNADITGKNTIGGIAASSSHGLISVCHVQGNITATEAPRWGGGPKTGGIVGELAMLASGEAATASEDVDANQIAVKGCYVNLSSLTFTGENSAESYAGQNDTMHRIAGKTVANMEPDVIDYDDEWEPIYGDPHAPEAGLVDNYAVSTLAPCSENIAQEGTSTEGLGIDKYDTGMGFFSELGWLYGFDAENPWSYTGDQLNPSLYFEGGILVVDPAEATIDEGSELTINLICKGGEITEDDLGGFSMEISDESVLEMGDMGMLGTDAIEGVYITVNGLKEGTSAVTLSLKGKSVTSFVTVRAKAGVSEIVAEGTLVTFDGRMVSAPSCAIEVYTTMGQKVLAANDSADLSTVGGGIYIVVATDAGGNRSSLKVRVR